jgi:malonate-semialdehyde dehydrogenase (acetylating)/methylmalonate-semialdehyde dehydrogenase
MAELTMLRNYIDGRWVDAEADGYLDVEDPSTVKALARVPLSTGGEIDRAVTAAQQTFAGWSRTPVSARCEPLFKLVELLRQHRDELAPLITAEAGKSLTDARAELKRNIENCQVACGMPTLIQSDSIKDCSADIDAEVIRMPIGVFGMIAPFNFPAMVPFWFLPYALAAGNTYVLKCSEQVPMTMQRQFELIDRCGFPPGVVNLVNGDKVASQALLEHRDVAGISFVGSSPVAKLVADTCARTGKRCQAFGSAKNYLVVMPDAKLDQVVRNMLTSCLGCAGQRCMAASVIACIGDDVYQQVVERFTHAARQAVVGNPLDPKLAGEALVLGPVISATALQRIEGLIQIGLDEGARLLLDGRGVKVEGCPHGHYLGPTVLTDVQPGKTLEQTEIFGPVVIIMNVPNLEAAIDAINRHPYGNGASIYTQSGYWARKFKLETQAGMIGINVGIPAPVAYLPFGGMKASLHADIKAQGKEVVNFFTHKKIITERYSPESVD